MSHSCRLQGIRQDNEIATPCMVHMVGTDDALYVAVIVVRSTRHHPCSLHHIELQVTMLSEYMRIVMCLSWTRFVDFTLRLCTDAWLAVHAYICACINVCMCMYVCLQRNMYPFVYIYMYICIYVYKNIYTMRMHILGSIEGSTRGTMFTFASPDMVAHG